ncbi:MAG: SWIM zinc finger family protein [Saprospiraceae bacterium]
MNFFLQQLEHFIDESLLIQGEDLFAQLGVISMREIESHLWSFKVVEDELERYEVEIQITPSKVKAYSCDCETYKAKGNCKHIIASLLALRREKNEQKKKKIQKKKVDQPTKKISTQQILDQLSKEELAEVIKEFCRQNRAFALSFKARYAYKVPLFDSQDTYLQLLESTIQMARRPDRTFNKRGAGQIGKILDEMLDQMQIHLIQHLYAEVFALAQSILIKIPSLFGKIAGEEALLLPQLKANFNILTELIESPIPPALKEKIWEFLFEEFQKIVYRNHQLDGLFHPLFIRLVEDKDQQEQLLDLSESLLIQCREEAKPIAQGLYFHFVIWQKRHGPNTVKQFIDHLIEDPAELHQLIQFCIKEPAAYDKAEQFAQIAASLASSEKEKEECQAYLLKLAELQQQQDKAMQLAEELFFQTKDLVYFRKIKKAAKTDWPDYLQKMLAKIAEQPDEGAFDQVLPQLYGEEQLLDELLAFITKKPSLNLLLNFDSFLLPAYQKQLRPIYLAEVQQYLTLHLGRITSNKIRTIIQHLHGLGAHTIGNELVEIIRKEYAERSSLMEELSLF